MNNIFSIKRFGKILKKDLCEFYSKYGLSILVYLVVYCLYWLLMTLLHVNTSANDRYDFIILLSFICGYFAPFKLYGYVNDPKEGIPFAMLPSSTLEKTTSMIINCMIATPLVLGILLVSSDLLFSVLPFGAYSSQYIFNMTVDTHFNSIGGNALTLEVVIVLAMLGNLLFKKHKVSITLLGSIALFLLSMRLFVELFIDKTKMLEDLTSFAKNIDRTSVTISTQDIPQSVQIMMQYTQHFLMIFAIVVIALSIIAIYRKIKTQKY